MKILSASYALIFSLLLSGCSNVIVPLKGTYQEKRYEFITSVPKDEV